MEINMDNLPDGIYFYCIEADGNRSKVQTMVQQRK